MLALSAGGRAARALGCALLLALAAGCGGRSDLPDGPAGAAASPGDGGLDASACGAGSFDCDGEPGCEVDPLTDPAHCGASGHSCAGGLAWPTGVAVDDARVYFTTFGQLEPGYGVVARAPKAGGAVEVLASGRALPSCVAVDAEAVYWVEIGAQAVFKLAL